MVKAHAGNTKFIGLSEENIVRLKAGQPIRFNGKDLGLPDATFLIIYGKTEEAIADILLGSSPLNTSAIDPNEKIN